jgi:biotin-(acetyl-CoA carboxylase) ligase
MKDNAPLDVPQLTDRLVHEFSQVVLPPMRNAYPLVTPTLLQALPLYLVSGFAPFQGEYEAANVLLGKTIRFSEGKAIVTGRVVSLGGDGRLYIQVRRLLQSVRACKNN